MPKHYMEEIKDKGKKKGYLLNITYFMSQKFKISTANYFIPSKSKLHRKAIETFQFPKLKLQYKTS